MEIKSCASLTLAFVLTGAFLLLKFEDYIAVQTVSKDLKSALILPLNQTLRTSHMKSVCSRYGKKLRRNFYKANKGLYSQTIIPKAFLVSEHPPAIVCYNQKVASQTWMTIFAKLYENQTLWETLNRTDSIYDAWMTLSPKRPLDLFNVIHRKRHFTFAVVRHPFDRLLSAFRDRIVDNPCLWQAGHFVPLIINYMRPRQYRLDQIKDKTSGCVRILPTFYEFVEYVMKHPLHPDTHWLPMTKQCSPCLVNYDAVIKLETVEADEKHVLFQSRIGEYQSMEYIHMTKGGHTEAVRSEFFKDIECRQIDGLEEMYKMDLEMFRYSAQPFYNLCKKTT